MASRKDIAYESSYHYKEEKDYPNVSCFFMEVRAVVKSSSNVKINADKKEGCTISMYVSDKSSIVYISTDMGNR